MIRYVQFVTVVLYMLVAVVAHGQHSLRQPSLRQPPPGQSLLGQSPLRFEHLSTAQGLSSNTIFSIYQDRDGFMWFGTGDGLNRYDGYTFTVYKPDPADPNNHMAHNNIWDMLESRSGEIWFVTPGGGLHRLDKRTGRVNFFRVERAGSGQVAAYDICYTLIEDRQGYLWIGSEGGLARFNPRTKQYRLYSVPVARGADGRVWSIQEGRFGTLWVGTATGLFTMNRQTGQFSPYYFGPDPAKPQPRIESMYLAADNSLWLAAFNDGLYQLRPGKKPSPGRDEVLTTYAPTGRKYLPNREIMPKGLGENEHHDLMVGTLSGLVQLDQATGQTITYRPNPAIPGSLSHEVVWALLADRRGSFWIGSANGIDHYSTLTPRFEFYQPIPDHNATPRVENNITMLSADRRGALWFNNATNDYIGKVSRLTLADQPPYDTTQPPAPDKAKSQKFVVYSPTDLISALHCDRNGRTWMAVPTGLRTLDAMGQLRHYPVSFTITSIDDDRQGKLWIAGQGKLAHFDPANGQYTLFQIDRSNPFGKGGGQVSDVLVTRSGDVWVTAGGVGACKLDPRSGRFTSYHPPHSGDKKIFYSRDVVALCETNDGAIWMATNIGGIFRVDPKTADVSTFTVHNGLPDNHIVALTTDQMGMLWLATNDKLCRLDPLTRQLRVFDEHDGLLGQSFTGACTSAPTGELAFGCTNGLVVFRPSDMASNTFVPPVYITRVRVQDSTRLFPTQPLTLSYRDNVISFDFVGLNYIAPEKNQYTYQLEGVNSGWVNCGTQRSATYSFLAPGTYVFRVKASNNDGLYNQQGASIQLTVLPPWWRAPWAYILYAILAALVVWALVRYRSRQLRKANQLLERNVALRTEEVIRQKLEIETQRNNLADTLTELRDTQHQLIQREKLASLGELTAGIAHEIQNPLNFVNNFSDLSVDMVIELEDEQKRQPRDARLENELLDTLKQNLQKISHHGNRASSIVQGMLEHSRMGSGERYPVDLNALVDEYIRLAYYGQRVRNPLFTCALVQNLQPNLGKVDLVGQDISRVLLNLFNNAFYAVNQRLKQANDDYKPTVTVQTRIVDKAVEIQVSDNGTGISDAMQQKIFQPFFTTKPSGEGTGLGLSLSYDIIKAHGGSLTVESREGEGCTFIIRLPNGG